jgi:hypothetical protein
MAQMVNQDHKDHQVKTELMVLKVHQDHKAQQALKDHREIVR